MGEKVGAILRMAKWQFSQLPLVECYPGQLNQVFMNLLSNALDTLDERDRHRSPEAMKADPSYIHTVFI